MNSNTTRKRKRPVTSCGECYRRKQKCNREQPCAICINRGVPEKCSFNTTDPEPDSTPTEQPPKCIALSDSPRAPVDTNISHSTSTPFDLGEQTGYASANGSNFSILQKSLRNADEVILNRPQRSDKQLPDFVLYQILQIERYLPPQEVQSQLIDLYFDQCWYCFSSLDPVSFRQNWELWHSPRTNNTEPREKDQQYFSALLFQLLAIGVHYLRVKWIGIWKSLNLTDNASADRLSLKYSNSGVQIMDLLGRHDSCVTAVQHDMLRGIWLKNASRGTESWYSLGNAIRQAQELRLHLKSDPPLSLSTEGMNRWLWQDEMRKRVWVCLFDWDAHVAFTLGRPRIINAGDCAKISLLACTIPKDTTKYPPDNVPSDCPVPQMITPVIFHSSVGSLIHQMLDCGADKPTFTDFPLLDRLHKQINDLLTNISPFFRYQNPDKSWDSRYTQLPALRLHLVSIANTYLIALHRAHALRRPESCEISVNGALTTLTAQEEQFKITDKHNWRIYTYCFYTIDASIFLAALLLEQPETLDRSWTNKISNTLRKSLDRLEEMQEASPMARTGAQILRKCQEKLEQQAIAKHLLTPPSNPADNVQENSLEGDLPAGNNVGFPDANTNFSLRSWIEQMDQVMLPILENDLSGPFDNTLWDVLLEG